MFFLLEAVSPSQILVSNPSASKLKRFTDVGIRATHNNMEVMRQCDIVVIAVKPQVIVERVNIFV